MEFDLNLLNNNLETTFKFHPGLTDNDVVDNHSIYHSEQIMINLDVRTKLSYQYADGVR